jgi:hypothetical protein
MRKRVYIETTIPSFYYEVRKEPEMIAQKLDTGVVESGCKKNMSL